MTFARHYASARLPLWLRVVLYALDHDGEPLGRGQLLRAVDPERLVRPAEVSRAIRHGVNKGLLNTESSAVMLLVERPGEAA